MKIVTCLNSDSQYGYVSYLKRSCKYFDLELIPLLYKGNWNSHRIKDKVLSKFLKTVADHTLILFTDAFDTMIVSEEKVMRRIFQRFGDEIVFSGEINCWPFAALANRYVLQNDIPSYPYLNSGGFIGYAGSIVRMYETYGESPSQYSLWEYCKWSIESVVNGRFINPDEAYSWSNQYYWTWVYLQNTDLISIDTSGDLFRTFSTEMDILNMFLKVGKDSELKEKLLSKEKTRLIIALQAILRQTNTNSCHSVSHLHLNGPICKKILYDGNLDHLLPWER